MMQKKLIVIAVFVAECDALPSNEEVTNIPINPRYWQSPNTWDNLLGFPDAKALSAAISGNFNITEMDPPGSGFDHGTRVVVSVGADALAIERNGQMSPKPLEVIMKPLPKGTKSTTLQKLSYKHEVFGGFVLRPDVHGMPVIAGFTSEDTWAYKSTNSLEYDLHDYRITHVNGTKVLSIRDCIERISREGNPFRLTFAPPPINEIVQEGANFYYSYESALGHKRMYEIDLKHSTYDRITMAAKVIPTETDVIIPKGHEEKMPAGSVFMKTNWPDLSSDSRIFKWINTSQPDESKLSEAPGKMYRIHADGITGLKHHGQWLKVLHERDLNLKVVDVTPRTSLVWTRRKMREMIKHEATPGKVYSDTSSTNQRVLPPSNFQDVGLLQSKMESKKDVDEWFEQKEIQVKVFLIDFACPQVNAYTSGWEKDFWWRREKDVSQDVILFHQLLTSKGFKSWNGIFGTTCGTDLVALRELLAKKFFVEPSNEFEYHVELTVNLFNDDINIFNTRKDQNVQHTKERPLEPRVRNKNEGVISPPEAFRLLQKWDDFLKSAVFQALPNEHMITVEKNIVKAATALAPVMVHYAEFFTKQVTGKGKHYHKGKHYLYLAWAEFWNLFVKNPPQVGLKPYRILNNLESVGFMLDTDSHDQIKTAHGKIATAIRQAWEKMNSKDDLQWELRVPKNNFLSDVYQSALSLSEAQFQELCGLENKTKWDVSARIIVDLRKIMGPMFKQAFGFLLLYPSSAMKAIVALYAREIQKAKNKLDHEAQSAEVNTNDIPAKTDHDHQDDQALKSLNQSPHLDKRRKTSTSSPIFRHRNVLVEPASETKKTTTTAPSEKSMQTNVLDKAPSLEATSEQQQQRKAQPAGVNDIDLPAEHDRDQQDDQETSLEFFKTSQHPHQPPETSTGSPIATCPIVTAASGSGSGSGSEPNFSATTTALPEESMPSKVLYKASSGSLGATSQGQDDIKKLYMAHLEHEKKRVDEQKRVNAAREFRKLIEPQPILTPMKAMARRKQLQHQRKAAEAQEV